MAWYTIDEAAQRGPGRRVWRQRILANEVKSYVDSAGRTLLWLDEAQTTIEPDQMLAAYRRVLADVAALREEVGELRRELGELKRRPAPPLAITVTEPTPAPRLLPKPEPTSHAPSHTRLLERVEATWTGSDRELERQAGLPKAFLAKAKKGLRGGPRSQASWDRLAAFLDRTRIAKAA